MKNQKQIKTTTLAEAEQTTEAEAQPEGEEAKEEALEATIVEDSTTTETIDIEITARRFHLSSWTHPTNLLQAVKGQAEVMKEAQWMEWVMFYVPWTRV